MIMLSFAVQCGLVGFAIRLALVTMSMPALRILLPLLALLVDLLENLVLVPLLLFQRDLLLF